MLFLFQAIPEDMVLQMVNYTDRKQVWDGLKHGIWVWIG